MSRPAYLGDKNHKEIQDSNYCRSQDVVTFGGRKGNDAMIEMGYEKGLPGGLAKFFLDLDGRCKGVNLTVI